MLGVKKMKKLLVYLNLIIIVSLFNYSAGADDNDKNDVLAKSYANLVSHYYSEVYIKTYNMHKSVNSFLESPTEETLQYVKNKWIEARKVYGITEAFRFYGGPIDGVNEYGEEGPEGLINAWPLNEAYIDYVVGNDKAGIINNLSYDVNEKTIIASNMSEDDADVSTGWHAIEFLLWGQDNSLERPGTRKASYYVGTDITKERRRTYLKQTSNLTLPFNNLYIVLLPVMY